MVPNIKANVGRTNWPLMAAKAGGRSGGIGLRHRGRAGGCAKVRWHA
jgi:hypothetical protein